MPGHEVCRSNAKNTALFDKYLCPHCKLLLKDAVQPLCGHWLCETCASQLLESPSPKCPRPDCLEDLKADEVEGAEYFPDRFVRREIEGMVVSCRHQKKGCPWEDQVMKLDYHLKSCSYSISECQDCGKILSPSEMESHKQICPKAMLKCPLAHLGCNHTKELTRQDLEKHVSTNELQHLQVIGDVLKVHHKTTLTLNTVPIASEKRVGHDDDDRDATGQAFSRSHDAIETDYAHSRVKAKGHRVQPDGPRMATDEGQSTTNNFSDWTPLQTHAATSLQSSASDIDKKMTTQFKRKDEEISVLRNTITKLEKTMRSKHAEFEDRDFRLSLIENSNHDGSMIWKIPQFSQRMADAQTGRYTSIFSLPFHTGRYGYKMCLRLYILGDGIGKNTHMSLFFVVMKGEFDNILPWPFTHKVTFKLINQTGGRDIIDTFQPDPMSSSFRKPKSDMNIASGCPRFASHTELKNGGFILEDTVFVKCSIDTSTVKNP